MKDKENSSVKGESQSVRRLKGIGFILLAAFGFSLMTTFVKLSGDLPTFEKAFFRNFVAMVVFGIIMIKQHISFIPEKKNVPDLFCRSFFGTLGLLCNFYAIDRLNIADANMLNKMSPFFAVIFSIIILKEKPKLVQIIGVITAFVGSAFIIKPTGSNIQAFPAFMGLLGGLGAGIAYTFVRKLGLKGVNGKVIIFYFSAFSCVLCLPFIIWKHEFMSLNQCLFLLLAGISACIGQTGITKAYMYAPAKEISVYDYTQVFFAAILGFFIFDEIPDKFSFIGYFLIISAGVSMFLYNRRLDRKTQLSSD